MNLSLLKRWSALIFVAAFLTACGEEAEETQDSALPDRSEDQLIEGTERPERVVNDPTPQTSTGGEIPVDNSVDMDELEAGAEPGTPEQD